MSEYDRLERWCYGAHEHSEHLTRKNVVTGEQLHCAGVTRDEAVVLDVLGQGSERYKARTIIAELDKARSVDPDYPMRYTRCPECGSVDVRVLDYGTDAPVAPVRACRTPDCRNFRR